MGKYVRRKSLAYAKLGHMHTHIHLHRHTHTIEGPDPAKRLAAVLKVQVRNARSSPENIPKSP